MSLGMAVVSAGSSRTMAEGSQPRGCLEWTRERGVGVDEV